MTSRSPRAPRAHVWDYNKGTTVCGRTIERFENRLTQTSDGITCDVFAGLVQRWTREIAELRQGFGEAMFGHVLEDAGLPAGKRR